MTGKEFENKFKQSCQEQKVLAIRLKDAGYQGEKITHRRFTIKNIADFIIFDNNKMLICELKHRKSSLAFEDITQEKALKTEEFNIQKYDLCNAMCGIIVCFGDLSKTFWIHINLLDELRVITNKKSFNFKDCMSILESNSYFGLIYKIKSFVPDRKRVERLDISFTNEVFGYELLQ